MQAKSIVAIGLFSASVLALVVLWSPMMTSANAQNTQEQVAENDASSAFAVFGGGCFWCVEKDFEMVDGVTQAISGYSGGAADNANYKNVASGNSNHVEVVKVIYDSKKVDYATLLEYFWRQINPTDGGGQFVDRGLQYRPVIFYVDETQKQLAQKSLQALAESGRYNKPMAVAIEPFDAFYEAEAYHQDYYKKSAFRYKTYRYGSGRDQYLEKIWGDDLDIIVVPESVRLDNAPDTPQSTETTQKGFSMPYTKPNDAELKEMLTPMQYKVTQEDGTEPPFQNEYNDEKRDGIYVDIVSGEPLFSSKDKYDSGTGWPSFSQPLVDDNIVTKKDFKLILPRTEVRSKHADSHLGHVFNDGPKPTGLRYCMNSAAMRFIPKEALEAEGYGQFLAHFENE